MDAEGRTRYADAIVRDALRLGDGDVLAVHGEPAHRELLVALAEAGYRAGCRYCDVVTTDLRVKRARALYAPVDTLGEQPAWHDRRMRDLLAVDAGVVTVNGPGDPGLMSDVPPERAARETTRVLAGAPRYLRAVMRGDARFCVIAWPTPAWAAQVFPELSVEDAVAALGQDLLHFARLSPEDPPDGWARHVARLEAVATELTARGLRELTLRGPGTDLRLGLPEGARWIGGTIQGRHVRFSPNVPTEEVFTSPSPRATEGTFACSRPLEIEGRTIDGIRAEFRRGRLVRIDAARPEDRGVPHRLHGARSGCRQARRGGPRRREVARRRRGPRLRHDPARRERGEPRRLRQRLRLRARRRRRAGELEPASTST